MLIVLCIRASQLHKCPSAGGQVPTRRTMGMCYLHIYFTSLWIIMVIPSLLWCKNMYTDIIGEMIEYYVSYVLHQFRPLFMDKDLSCLRNRQSNSIFSFSGEEGSFSLHNFWFIPWTLSLTYARTKEDFRIPSKSLAFEFYVELLSTDLSSHA